MPNKNWSRTSARLSQDRRISGVGLMGCLFGGVAWVLAASSTAQATVVSLNSDGTYTTETRLDFRQQKKIEMEKLIAGIPVTRVPSAATQPPMIHDVRIYQSLILSAGEKYDNLNSEIIQAVIQVESNFNTKAVSPKGAQGLMQLMPATAKQLGVLDAFDPLQNISAGSSELSRLVRLYDSLPIALAAYNAGEGAVAKYDGIPPFVETRAYVLKVLTEIVNIQKKKISALSDLTAPVPLP